MFRFLSIFFSILSYSSFASGHKIAVKVAIVKNVEFYKQISLPAECLSIHSKDYFARSDGFVNIIPQNNKHTFKKGELIFAIDKLLSDALKAQAEADFKAANTSMEKDNQLFHKNIISQAQLEKTSIIYHTAKAKLAEAIKNYDNKVICAPFDGNISIINFKIGEHVKAGEFLFNLTASKEKLIRFAVPQAYKIDDESAEGLVVDQDKIYKLEIIAISKVLSNNHGNYSATAYVYSDNELEHNSFVSVNLRYAKHINIGISEKSLIKSDAGSQLFIVGSDNKVKLVTVSLGDRINDLIEITSGNVPVDAIIVTDGIHKLADNDMVEIVE